MFYTVWLRKLRLQQWLWFPPLHYCLLGADIFPLKKWLIKPNPGKNMTEDQKIYSYRQSLCRRVIENAFSILSARWRIFDRPIRATVEHIEQYVLAALALHNYLRQTSTASYTLNGFVDSEECDCSIHLRVWRNRDNRHCMEDIRPICGCRNLEVIQMFYLNISPCCPVW